MALSFYDIDKDYVKYLQKEETNERGFTRVPNVEYPEIYLSLLAGWFWTLMVVNIMFRYRLINCRKQITY